MPSIINTNIASINAQRNLAKSQGALQTSLQRLSSGLRINSAKDDAAGLAISNRFTTQVRGLNVAVRNANDGISLLQTTESALDEITTSLQRIRDLAVQAANDSNSQADRVSLQEEVDQLVSEIDRISSTTTFNGRKVLNGSVDQYSFQIGANAGENVTVKGVDARVSALGSQPGATQVTLKGSELVSAASGSVTAFNISYTSTTAGNSIDVAQTAYGGTITGWGTATLKDSTNSNFGRGVAKDLAARINELREKGVSGLDSTYATAKTTFSYSDIGSIGAGVAASAYVGQGTMANGDLKINGVDIGPVSFLEKDADGSLVSAINAKSQTTGVTASVDAQGRLTLTAEDGRDLLISTANGSEDKLFNGGLANADITAFDDRYKSGDLTISAQETVYTTQAGSIGATAKGLADNVQALGTVANADISTIAGANTTIKSIDSALTQIDSFRGTLGAIQNRFESTIRNLSSISESLSAANSRIKDADFALESANLSKNQVLQQAGNSILAQANALPQQVLSLLQGG